MEGFLFSGVFWGCILILWGLSVIINTVFHVEIPIFRIIIAFIFVYVGLKLLWGGYRMSGRNGQNVTMFSDNRIKYNPSDENKEFNVIFGKTVIDLSEVPLAESVNVKVNSVFGEAVVEINTDMPVKAQTSAVFGAAFTPDESVTSFGQHIYRSPSFSKDSNYLDIEANVVFGGIKIQNKK